MVRGDDGHGHRCRVDELYTFSHARALLSLDCFLFFECRHLRTGLHHLHPAILSVSRDLESDDPGPYQLAVSGNHPHGLCHAHRDVGFHLCSALGPMGHLVRVGDVDCGCGCGSIGDSLAVLHPVSTSILGMTVWHTSLLTGYRNVISPHLTASPHCSCCP